MRWCYSALVLLLVGCGGGSGNSRSEPFEATATELDRAGALSASTEAAPTMSRGQAPSEHPWLGINAFANDLRFGPIRQQFLEVRDRLKIRMVRLLFAWNDQVQPDPNLPPDFAFYDELVASLPTGVEATVVLTGLPTWMTSPAAWDGGNPRASFVNRWVRLVVNRYESNPQIIGWEIWNEPEDAARSDNLILDLPSHAEHFVQLLSLARQEFSSLPSRKLLVSGATSSITADYPAKLSYNQAMYSAGAEEQIDVWGVHFYSRDLGTFNLPGGPAEFLNQLTVPVWITESGARGYFNQLSYFQEVWPALRAAVPIIDRIYAYQFAEDAAPENSYGLRTLSPDPQTRHSDLYNFLASQ